MERRVTMKASRTQRYDAVSGVTNRSSDQADPERWLGWVRRHWQVENKIYGVRDVTFDEDRSQVRCGSIPQVMVAFRNTALGLICQAAETNIAAAYRRVAAKPCSALALVGIIPKN